MRIYFMLSASRLYDLAKEKTTTFLDKITNDPLGTLFIPLVELALIFLLGALAIRLCSRIVNNLFSPRIMDTNRAYTLRKLTNSVIRYSIYFCILFYILVSLGFNPLPILAGAGILGLAIGFGAQSLVKDIITGFFLIFERQLEVGDTVQINRRINGVIEEVGLRTTKIREYNQRLHYIPNGMITQVTNYNRDKMRAIVHVTVPFDTDIEKVVETLEKTCITINTLHKDILQEEATISGITNIAHHGLQYTITALTDPEYYSSVETDIRQETVLSLRKNGIPFANSPIVIENSIISPT